MKPSNTNDITNDITIGFSNLFCFSHLRWNFVYQRPQHLMSRFANVARVFFFEEPIYEGESATLDVTVQLKPNVTVLVPKLPPGTSKENGEQLIQGLLEKYLAEHQIEPEVFWYYSPMALNFTRGFQPLVSIYDCMDELTGFLFAPPELIEREAELFNKVDAVFTGGNTLYKAKQEKHPNVHPFPSSIDKDHFTQARMRVAEPVDQQAIAHPRLGFYGVLDERLDLALIDQVAARKPDWNFIFIGPVVKIDPASLPNRGNIHYLGGRTYNELPSYLSGWDIAIMPFAKNPSTKYISPTKTPEYLAGGKPVISTSIEDVVNDYANDGLVSIADTPEIFIKKAQEILDSRGDKNWLQAVDKRLATISWDKTWSAMLAIIKDLLQNKMNSKTKTAIAHV